jgi:hypothetical protein
MSQDSALEAVHQWQELSNKFETLAKQEPTQAGPRLRATAAPTFTPHGDVGKWRLVGAISDNIRERFALIGTQAGFALGTPPGGADMLDYWLHRLSQNVCDRATGPQQETHSCTGIESVCEESSTFCIGLQRQALAAQADFGTLADCFSKWIDDNSSLVEPFYWSTPGSVRNWISCVASGAKASIPIHFLSARLNVNRLPLRPSEHDSLRTFFDQIAKEHELIWCITRSGLWMAQQPPKPGAYIDAHGRQQGDVIDHCTSERYLIEQAEERETAPSRAADPIPISNGSVELAEDKRSIRIGGVDYKLSLNQGKMMAVLLDAKSAGRKFVLKHKLNSSIGKQNGEPRDSWKNHELWGSVVKSEKGRFWLNIPDSNDQMRP